MDHAQAEPNAQAAAVEDKVKNIKYLKIIKQQKIKQRIHILTNRK